jgi:hypothetical protein
MEIQEVKVENNDIITINYNGYKFEVDVWEGNIIFIDEKVIKLFTDAGVHNVERQRFNVFLSRLVSLLNKKSINVTNDDDVELVINMGDTDK